MRNYTHPNIVSKDKTGELTKIFVSYSRKDTERASIIAELLRDNQFTVFMDTDDILPTEEWRVRLQDLISDADTIIFLLSPHSAASDVCAWEAAYAESQNKRIAPVVIENVDGNKIPSVLSRLNFIFWTSQESTEIAINTIIDAILTNIDWIRQHTRLGAQAARWVHADRSPHLLLRSRGIAEAEAWRNSQPTNAPNVTRAQSAFIDSSRMASTRRTQSWIAASLLGMLLAMTLSIWALINAEEAELQRAEAQIQANTLRIKAVELSIAEGRTDYSLLELIHSSELFLNNDMPDDSLISFKMAIDRAVTEKRITADHNSDIFSANNQLYIIDNDEGILFKVTERIKVPIDQFSGKFIDIIQMGPRNNPIIHYEKDGEHIISEFDPNNGFGDILYFTSSDIDTSDIHVAVDGSIVINEYFNTSIIISGERDNVITVPGQLNVINIGIDISGALIMEVRSDNIIPKSAIYNNDIYRFINYAMDSESIAGKCLDYGDVGRSAYMNAEILIETYQDFSCVGRNGGFIATGSFRTVGDGGEVNYFVSGYQSEEWLYSEAQIYTESAGLDFHIDDADPGNVTIATANHRTVKIVRSGVLTAERTMPTEIELVVVLSDHSVAVVLSGVELIGTSRKVRLIVFIDEFETSSLFETRPFAPDVSALLPLDGSPVNPEARYCFDEEWLIPVRGKRPIAPSEEPGLLVVEVHGLTSKISVPRRYVERSACIEMSWDGSWYYSLLPGRHGLTRAEFYYRNGESIGGINFPIGTIISKQAANVPSFSAWIPGQGVTSWEFQSANWRNSYVIASEHKLVGDGDILEAKMSPDGRFIVFAKHEGRGNVSTYLYSIQADRIVMHLHHDYKVFGFYYLEDGSLVFDKGLSPYRFVVPSVNELRTEAFGQLSEHCKYSGEDPTRSPCWAKPEIFGDLQLPDFEDIEDGRTLSNAESIWYSQEPHIFIHSDAWPETSSIVERELFFWSQELGTLSAMALLFDVSKGEVIADVSISYGDTVAVIGRQAFEPGSSIKPFILAVALEEEIVTRDSEIETTPINSGRIRISDFHRIPEKISLFEAMEYSSNTAFARISGSIDPIMMKRYFAENGIGDLEGRYLTTDDNQEQIETYFSTGTHVMFDAYDLTKIYKKSIIGGGDATGTEKSITTGSDRQAFSSKTALLIRSVLDYASQSHRDYVAREDGGFLDFSGRSGAVYKRGHDGIIRKEIIVNYVAHFPSFSPRYILTVVLDEPIRDRYYSASRSATDTALPVIRGIIEKIYDYEYQSSLDGYDEANHDDVEPLEIIGIQDLEPVESEALPTPD